ncbi:unnamed protein product [Cuscuta europaea]|uniref:Uncharacterized protein n=1 Tax=Cuscuta europaea TaxID=41803 RepID=A0A9P0ZFC5_CUSEU|nr:unnamed protein product [Cuscuta europaea]
MPLLNLKQKERCGGHTGQRLMPGWIPRRLGGGLGGKKESGQLRFGGRERPFRAPLRQIPFDDLKRLGIEPPPEGRYMTRFQVPSPPRRERSSGDSEGSPRKYNQNKRSHHHQLEMSSKDECDSSRHKYSMGREGASGKNLKRRTERSCSPDVSSDRSRDREERYSLQHRKQSRRSSSRQSSRHDRSSVESSMHREELHHVRRSLSYQYDDRWSPSRKRSPVD